MANDLAILYRELQNEKQTQDVKRLRKNIENKLNDRMRENIVDLLEIGDIIGFDKLEREMKTAGELVAKMKKINSVKR